MSSTLVHPDAPPVATGPHPRITTVRPPGMPPLPPMDHIKLKVLIVESDVDCARLMEFVLNLRGYKVTVARDIASAEALIRTECFGQIVMDVSLPDGSGLDLLKLVRQDMGLSVPVAVVSGMRQQRVIEDCMSAGASDFVYKPFSPSELVTRLGKWTGR